MAGRAQAVLVVLLASSGAGAVDLTGKWRFETIGSSVVEITQVTQTGSALSFSLYGWSFSGSVTPVGSFTNYSVNATSPTPASITGRAMPSGDLLDGRIGALFPPNPPEFGGVFATRCTCDDGNTADGDGCDAACQIEPCWTCAGDPSICSPAGDGSPCEDGSPCTTGETCTAGVCGGGAPVVPCTDMTGHWYEHEHLTGLDPSDVEFANDVAQRGSDLIFRNPISYIGTIDPATGVFDVRVVNPAEFCPPFDPLAGTVSADGLSFTATGSHAEVDPNLGDQCNQFPVTVIGSRHCGSGTLDPSETCDDGNLATGDGCDASCAVEPCWICAGEPSTCSPTAGAACDDGDPCTTGDTCTGTGACVGTSCGPCLACAAGVGCVAGPRSPCKASLNPRHSSLSLRNATDAVRDRLAWAWREGEETAPGELGDPPGGDGFTLCLYDESGPEPTLLFRAAVPGGGVCDGRPCWRPTGGGGFAYQSKTATPEGVATARLRPRPDGYSRSLLTGRGAHLADRSYPLPALPLPLPLRAQLHGAGGLCFETRHDASGVVKNDPTTGRFKARGTP